MRITTNTKMIKRRAKIGTWASLGGIAVLAVGMFASLQRNSLVYLSFVALIAGFILAQYGNYNIRRWGRSPRPDEILAESLKGLDDKHTFYAWTLPAPYVLLTPHGLYTFVTRDQGGQISVSGANWKTKMTAGRLFLAFAQEGMGNPTLDAEQVAGKLQKAIQDKLPELQFAVRPAVVFIDPRVQLTVTDPTIPVMAARDLKKWLRGPGKGEFFKNADLRALEAALDEMAAAKLG